MQPVEKKSAGRPTRIVVIDTETTGMDPEQGAEVIEVAIREGLEDDVDKAHFWQIRPLRGVPEEAAKIHGITTEMTLNWPTFGEIADQIAPLIQSADVVVGYNPDFDLKMLRAEFQRCDIQLRWPKVVLCAKRLWDLHRPRPPRDLQAAYKEFVDAAGFEGAHGALVDARRTAQVFQAQLDLFNLHETDWVDMDPERKEWWGPSNHVLVKDGVLICNFGKHKGLPFHRMDNGMLGWILKNDFPRHVKDLATKAMEPWRGKKSEQVQVELLTWAQEYL
jgi:DNA polymerase-3 subunit epsilon